MLNDYLNVKIFIDEIQLRDFEIDELSIVTLSGSIKSTPPDAGTKCNVLVTRIINETYVTLELIGIFSEVMGNSFSVVFTDVSRETIDQINNIMLPTTLAS